MITRHSLEIIDGFTFNIGDFKEYVFLFKFYLNNSKKYICVRFMDDHHFNSMNLHINTKEEYLNRFDENNELIEENVRNIYELLIEDIKNITSIKKIHHLIGIDLYFLLDYLNNKYC